MTTIPTDPSAPIRQALESSSLHEEERRDLLRQALVYAEEVRDVFLREKIRADQLEKANVALELAAKELEDNLDVLRRTDRERRRLVVTLVTAQEEERKRIAGDIHDDSIQVMAAVGMGLATIRKRVSDASTLELLNKLEVTLEESIRRLRSLLFVLRPISLEREGLAVALREYIAMTQEEEGPTYEVVDELKADLPEELTIIMFRIAQEALVNIRKHAKAHEVQVLLELENDGISLTVRDDGQGFVPTDAAAGHLGILSSRERAEQAEGWFRVESSPDVGTTVQCWVPLEPRSEE